MKSNSLPRNTWHEYFYQPEPPVTRKFWKGIGYLLFSIPLWILAVVAILAAKS